MISFNYTARKKFSVAYAGPGPWTNYVEWARLPQLKEIIGLDSTLSKLYFGYETSDMELYNYLIIDDGYATGLFSSEAFVSRRLESIGDFNFLAVCKNPDIDCSKVELAEFNFFGYELLDKYYDHSALTNCGGFDETFLPSELNAYGLLDNFERALEVRDQLVINNPGEDHADCNLFGIWRHRASADGASQ